MTLYEKTMMLDDGSVDSAIKSLSPALSVKDFSRDGELEAGLSLCKAAKKKIGCENCPACGLCNHSRGDGFITLLTLPLKEGVRLWA